MKKLLVIVLATAPVAAMAAGENNVGTCGWGSKVFEGQRGVAPQVLAATTNGTSWNQTFGITFGTSGCTQDGVVSSNWKTALFIDGNKQQLARDMAVGSGETLDSLAHLLGLEAQDRALFNRVAKDNMARLFPNDQVDTQQVVVTLRELMASDARLARYTAAL